MESKIGRNDLCPCGSGKKYKKCCLMKNDNLIIDKIDITQIQKEVEYKVGEEVKLSRIDHEFDFDKYQKEDLLEDLGEGLYRVKKSNLP